jgi:hypothetical protein
VTHYEPANTKDVHIVILNALMRRKSVLDHTGPHTCYLISRDASPNAATADGNATHHFPGSDGMGQRHDKIRVVIFKVQFAVAKIDYVMVRLAQSSDEMFLQFKSSVVGSNANTREHLPIGTIVHLNNSGFLECAILMPVGALVIQQCGTHA